MIEILCDRCGNFVPDSELESQETFNYHKDLKKCHPKSEERLENEIKKLQSKLDIALKGLNEVSRLADESNESWQTICIEILYISRKSIADIESIK